MLPIEPGGGAGQRTGSVSSGYLTSAATWGNLWLFLAAGTVSPVLLLPLLCPCSLPASCLSSSPRLDLQVLLLCPCSVFCLILKLGVCKRA